MNFESSILTNLWELVRLRIRRALPKFETLTHKRFWDIGSDSKFKSGKSELYKNNTGRNQNIVLKRI